MPRSSLGCQLVPMFLIGGFERKAHLSLPGGCRASDCTRSGGATCTARSTPLQPFSERRLALSRCLASQQTLHADVLVQTRPMDTHAAADQSPFSSLRRRAVQETGVPRQWHGYGSPVTQVDAQAVLCHPYIVGEGNFNFDRGSTHSKPPIVRFGSQLPSSEFERSPPG